MEMLVVILVFFWCFLNYDVAFKIINRLKVNNNNFKFNGNFKVSSQLREYQKILEEYFHICI
jgi:uncharacterized protein YybS (DUF2232 family)